MDSHLITIGQLAKISRTHIKALRYYEKIGILTPIYINSENRYRYYSLSQATLVEIIKLCTENDVPLKKLTQYLNESQSKIALKNLIEYATSLVQDKIQSATRQMAYLQYMNQEIDLSHEIHQHQAIHHQLKPANYWITPFEGTILSEHYFEAIQQEKETLQQFSGTKIERIGLLIMSQNQTASTYSCLKLAENSDLPQQENLLRLPELYTHIEHVNLANLEERIGQIYQQHQPTYLFITETFEDDFDLKHRHLELQFDEIRK